MKVCTVLHGGSQTGKSSFTSTLLEHFGHGGNTHYQSMPQIGSGNGTSVTNGAFFYEVNDTSGVLTLVVDQGGWNDNQLRFTPAEGAERTCLDLVENSVDRMVFLVFESLRSDTCMLLESIKNLEEGYGEKAKESVVVVGTKRDVADNDELPGRIACIYDVMAQCGIAKDKLVFWQNKKLSNDQLHTQVNQLLDAIAKTPPVATDVLQSLNARIHQKADELCKAQVPRTRQVPVEVNEAYSEMINEWEVVGEETEDETSEHRTNALDDFFKRDPVWAGAASALTFGILPAIMTNQVTVHKTVIKKTVPKYAWVPRAVTKSRVVVKQMTVEEPLLPIEHFWPAARELVVDETRQKYRK
ncbi:hypothetical protein ACA910_003517 [Epithemia clementina (nom. ined.)]